MQAFIVLQQLVEESVVSLEPIVLQIVHHVYLVQQDIVVHQLQRLFLHHVLLGHMPLEMQRAVHFVQLVLFVQRLILGQVHVLLGHILSVLQQVAPLVQLVFRVRHCQKLDPSVMLDFMLKETQQAAQFVLLVHLWLVQDLHLFLHA